MSTDSGATPTLAPRIPDGWWTGHARYRSYVAFAGTGLVLIAVNLLLLLGLRALATSAAAWANYLAFLRSPPGLTITIALLVGTLYFALRWLRVGAKIPGALLGSIQNQSAPALMAAHYAGFLTVSLLVIVLLSGIVI